jgi:hypothetical protein
VGIATLKAAPELLRVKLLLTGEGKDAREAVAALQKRRDEVKAKLTELGAVDGSIDPGEAIVGAQGNLTPQQLQMQIIMMRNAQGRAGGATEAKKPTTVTVSATMQVDLPLTTAASDALLVSAEELQAKVRAAVPKKAAPAAKTPEEAELAEEMESNMNVEYPGAAAMPKADEPSFQFVHRVTEAERAKLAADALAVANADAARLASAAGRKLGAIRQLSASGAAGTADESNPYAAYIQAMSGASAPAAAGNVVEATGNQATSVTYAVRVSVAFDLE